MNKINPVISVIIPSHNRTQQLRNLLNSFINSTSETYAFEIIVVDDGSEPPLLVDTAHYSFSIIFLRQENKGPAQSRNNGAMVSKGKYLLFTDDDCIPFPNWMSALLKTINHQPDMVIGGRIINGLPENNYSQATQLLFDYLHEARHPGAHQLGFFTTNNLCVPKKTFLHLKGFNVALRFGEDREFCSRLILSGKHLAYAEDAPVYHFHDLTFHSFIKLHFQYGGGTYNFYQLTNFEQPMIPLARNLLFYARLILSPFKNYNISKAFLYSSLLAISQVSNTFGYLWQSLTQLHNTRTRKKENSK